MLTKGFKKILKSPWIKIIIKLIFAIILFCLASLIYAIKTSNYTSDGSSFGWPFYYFNTWMTSTTEGHKFNIFSLIMDILFWYFVLYLIILAYKKVKKIKQ